MSKKITFTNVHGLDFFPPKPAVREVPEWYKNTPEYVTDQGKKYITPEDTPHTIKKCIPVFDAITAGYILYTQVEIQVFYNGEFTQYCWPSQNAIDFHPVTQAPLHPKKNDSPYPKWVNPYAIKTPPGYSTLFLPPMHNPNKIFTILEGIVDTEGIIPAGTPMAQVIPFKRESWKHNIGSDKELQEQKKVREKLSTLLYNSYKKQFWVSKDYR